MLAKLRIVRYFPPVKKVKNTTIVNNTNNVLTSLVINTCFINDRKDDFLSAANLALFIFILEVDFT